VDLVFRALADPNRRRLLDLLYERNGQSLSQLSSGMGITRQAVAKHLAVLEEANLVASVWRGREKLHYLNPMPINEISERWIHKYERNKLRALSSLKQALEQKHGENP
jgi:DNA-binding transcriptional ArsR family regulator